MSERCFGTGKDFYERYHDEEWGVPVHDDQMLFEMLCLEGAQAGLSWETVLVRRDGYRSRFHGFDPNLVVQMTDEELEEVLKRPDIIRNRLKVYSVRKNAKVVIAIQEEFGSFDAYLWQYVNHSPLEGVCKFRFCRFFGSFKPIFGLFLGGTYQHAYMSLQETAENSVKIIQKRDQREFADTLLINQFEKHADVPARTEISDAISKDLKKRGMSFVGSTIIYAFMQAVGMVNDHLLSCPSRRSM